MWEETYAELLNKIRWSIATAAPTAGITLPFATSKALASLFASDVVRLLKLLDEKPNLDIADLAKSERRTLTEAS